MQKLIQLHVFILLFLPVLLLSSCSFYGNRKQNVQAIDDVPQMTADTANIENEVYYYPETETTEDIIKDTRIQFKTFGVIFHHFKGYVKDQYIADPEDEKNFEHYAEYKRQAALIIDYPDSGGYKETLIAKTDTLHLGEDLDERINNTLIEIIPNNKGEKFKIYHCYLSNINEIIDDRNLTPEERDKRITEAVQINEITAYSPVKDSAKFFFRAFPHMPDMVAVNVTEGGKIEVESNTKEQIDWENAQFDKDLQRIKKKYNLRDTLVVIPGEYDTVATLTKDGKLFGYSYGAHVFKIERYIGRKLIETKYVIVYISYGC